MLFNQTIQNVYNRLKDLMQDRGGGTVTDIVLDLLNRGQRRIVREKQWDYLIADVVLTLVGAVATLPTDCDEIIEVGHDVDNDGKIDFYYYLNGRYGTGYKLDVAFNKTSGFTSRTITFFETPMYPAHLRYKKQVPDFTATTDFTVFPENLLLRAAQLERAIDESIDSLQLQALEKAYSDELKAYVNSSLDSNADMRNEINDDFGDHVITQDYALDGTSSPSTRNNVQRSTLSLG
jgi:hypothetical protein